MFRPETVRWGRVFVLGLAVAAVPQAAIADVPMFLVASLLKFASIPALIVVLLIEAAALKWAFGFGWKGAMVTSVVANAASAAVGVVLYPMIGGVFYAALAPYVIGLTGGGAGIEIAATLLGVSLIDTFIELPIVALIRKVQITLRATLIYLGANILGGVVLILAIVGWSDLVPQRIPEEEVARLEAHYAEEIAFMRQIFEQLPEKYDSREKVFDRYWVDSLKAPAEAMRFNRLSVSGQYIQYIVLPRKMHNSSGRRGEGVFVSGDVEVFRTEERDGAWYWAYRLRHGIRSDALDVTANFDPLP